MDQHRKVGAIRSWFHLWLEHFRPLDDAQIVPYACVLLPVVPSGSCRLYAGRERSNDLTNAEMADQELAGQNRVSLLIAN